MDHFIKSNHALFDVIYNCETFTKEEVMRSIIGLMKEKKMVL